MDYGMYQNIYFSVCFFGVRGDGGGVVATFFFFIHQFDWCNFNSIPI